MRNLFDLNIENVLEHWNVEHAIREIIANALDEQTLTGTAPVDITFSNGICHIRDYGRGLQYIHFTQNENQEKQNAAHLIGKFGVGLKDALAVFYRKHIHVVIHSRFATIALQMSRKTGFDIETLHAVFSEPKNPYMQGTDVILTGVTQSDLEKAKAMFLVFREELKLLEVTPYGEVYAKNSGERACIYANGVQIATEANFMFSYNITSMNAQMKKALNRERSNVGRTAYSDTIKNILKKCKSDAVMRILVSDIKNTMSGTNKDETGWVDVASYAAKTMNHTGKVVFMTPSERASLTNQQVEILSQSGKELIMVTDAVYGKIANQVETFQTVSDQYSQSFRYKFITCAQLSQSEKDVFDIRKPIMALLLRKYPSKEPNMRISETIRVDCSGFSALGVWDTAEQAIIIKRSVLESKMSFAGVLMHEFAHYYSGYTDNTRAFENVLTEMLGYVYTELSKIDKDNPVKEEPTAKRRFQLFGRK